MSADVQPPARGGLPITGPVEPRTPDTGLTGPAYDPGGRGADSPTPDPPRPPVPTGRTEQVLCPDCRGKVLTPVQGNSLAVAARTCPCVVGSITIFYCASLLDGQTHVVRLGGDPPNERCLCSSTIPAAARADPGSGPICVPCWTALADIQPSASPQRAKWA